MRLGHNGATVTIGPPGAGKTERLLRQLEHETRERGVPLHEIAFVTFTRAAREEASDRVIRALGADEDGLPWFRTIHSAAYELLRLTSGSVMDVERWSEFGRRYGYRFGNRHDHDDEGHLYIDPEGDDEALVAAHERRVNQCETRHRTASESLKPAGTIDLLEFEARLAEFKRTEHLLEFGDLLVEVLRGGQRPPVRVAFVDEAQDLSPLQIKVVERWFASCERVYVSGDPAQAIYTFGGADPVWLRELARSCHAKFLSRSRRVPRRPARLAHRLLRRVSPADRTEWVPRNAEGAVEVVAPEDAASWAAAGGALVLFRNRRFAWPLGRLLLEDLVPYTTVGDLCFAPLSDRRACAAVGIADRLRRGASVHAADLRLLIEFVPITRHDLVPLSVRAVVDQAEGRFTPAHLDSALGLGGLVRGVRESGPVSVMLKKPHRWRRYITALLAQHGNLPAPEVVLSTIHGAKGRQHDRVVVFPDLARRTRDALAHGGRAADQREASVFYVGVTRTCGELAVVLPRSRGAYDLCDLAVEKEPL